jgi:tetratricopeptide (TPR) repeat protein
MSVIRISLLIGWALVAGGAGFGQTSGDDLAAVDAYKAQIKLHPDDVAAHVNLGVVLAHLGRYDEAIAEYEAAEKLLPGDPRIALNEALAYDKSGRIREAEQRFADLHKSHPDDNKMTLLLADCYLQMGENQQVIELLEPIQARNADDLGFAYMLGTALIRQGRIADGQVFLDRILRNGDTAEARFLLGTRMFASGDYPNAVKQLASAIELNPNLPQLQSFYGRALLETGDPDGAAAAFRKELARNPNDFAANLGLGEILTEQKQFSEANTVLQRALTLRPQSAEAQLALGECFTGTGDLQKARPHLEVAVNSLPGSLEAHRNLLDVYTGLHLRPEAAREAAITKKLELAARANEPGPKTDEVAPEFALPDSASDKIVRLADIRRKAGAVIVFGSYSCPNFRSSADELKRLYRQYGARVPFLLVYIREAHANGYWQSTRNEREGVELEPAANMTEKQDHAVMCSRKLHLPFPAVVDGMNGAVENAYAAWPSRLFVVGKDGRVRYSTRLTELDFHPVELEAVLRKMEQ